jgi:very-short-patch-repair endonuclease
MLRLLPGDVEVRRQTPFPWRDALPGRVDNWIPAYNAIVEADGRRWHARLRDFDRDRWRDNIAVSKGVAVLRFTWVHLTQRPREARELVLATGQQRAAA